MTRARQILLFLGACTLVACGGDDDDDGIIIADSGPTADSGPDAGAACGDFAEGADATNDAFEQVGATGTAEASGIAFAAGDTKVVCGSISDAHYDAESTIVDIDAFEFDVGAGAPLRVVLRADAPEGVTVVALLQFMGATSWITVAGGDLADGYALATSFQEIEATGRLVVLAISAEEPTAPIDYELEIGNTIPCDAVAADADYTETSDGAQSRRNDVVTATWGAEGLDTMATTPTTDNPEATELTLEADTPVRITGTSGNHPANDSYRDKDSFAIALGEDVNEIDFRVTWADEATADLDGLIFAADMPMSDITGTGAAFSGTTADEVVSTRVTGGGNVWVWVGNYDDGDPMLPMDYDITICPRTFTP